MLHESEETNTIVNGLKKRESDLLAELKRKKEISKRLEKEIKELIAREAKKNRFESLDQSEKVISMDFEKNKGKLPWPTQQGVITGKFGEHADPVIKDIIVRNNGIDITTLKESKVRAVFNGMVSKIFTIKGANSTVIIQHGNYFTVYHNIINVSVKVGEKVSMKDTIGEVYTDYKKGVSILHFELYKEFVKQNPELWLSN